MAGPDLAAQEAISRRVIHPVFVVFLDILGEPVRATTAPYSIQFSGTGDTDLDGQVFTAVDATLVDISPINTREGGADTVTATLSGLIGVDSDLLNQIGNKLNWQGRTGRIWQMMYDENLRQVGNIWPIYTGYMNVPRITGSAREQTIVLEIESYLAFLTQASNRSYLSQQEFDSGDRSAEASIAVANGTNLIPSGGAGQGLMGGIFG